MTATDPARSATRQPNLGLVCITTSDAVRFRTITRTRLLALSPPARTATLRALYQDNLRRLGQALDFCRARGIRLYRISSGIFPFADDEAGEGVLQEFAAELRATGERATARGIRLVLHPDQFVVLSSDEPRIVDNSVKMLAGQARLMDYLAQPRSPWATIELHGGKGGRKDRLVEVVRALPEPIRSRLALENDERAYGAEEILEACRAAGVPMVFDAHHHVCRERLSSYDHPSVAAMLAAASETWPDPAWQLVHISNGRGHFSDPHHSDVITVMPSSYREAPWIEVEAKHKEEAIARLQTEWLGQLSAA